VHLFAFKIQTNQRCKKIGSDENEKDKNGKELFRKTQKSKNDEKDFDLGKIQSFQDRHKSDTTCTWIQSHIL
jgi:hypothetical protein